MLPTSRFLCNTILTTSPSSGLRANTIFRMVCTQHRAVRHTLLVLKLSLIIRLGTGESWFFYIAPCDRPPSSSTTTPETKWALVCATIWVPGQNRSQANCDLGHLHVRDEVPTWGKVLSQYPRDLAQSISSDDLQVDLDARSLELNGGAGCSP